MVRKPTLVPTKKGVEDVNLGITDQPKLVKLSKKLSPESKAMLNCFPNFLMFLRGVT